MNLSKRLKAFFAVIVSEVERNEPFAQQVRDALELVPPTKAADAPRRGRRAPGVLDPFEIAKRGDLEARLNELTVEQLKDLIAEHRMDRSTKVMKWKGKDKLVLHIIATVNSRMTKGDVFRSPPDEQAKSQPEIVRPEAPDVSKGSLGQPR